MIVVPLSCMATNDPSGFHAAGREPKNVPVSRLAKVPVAAV